MQQINGFYGVLFIIFGLAGSLQTAQAHEADGVAKLSWLAGCWSAEGSEPGSGEHWMHPAAGTMLGVNRSVKEGKTRGFEFMRIHEAADGRLLFTALPSGQKEATFTQIRLDESEVAFENPEHDFPQRIIYRLKDSTHLIGSIEGVNAGVTRVIEFPMQRVSCE